MDIKLGMQIHFIGYSQFGPVPPEVRRGQKCKTFEFLSCVDFIAAGVSVFHKLTVFVCYGGVKRLKIDVHS